MRKSFADLLGVKSLFLFLFAVAALMGVGSASAQNMSFKNVPLSLSANGVAGATTVTGGAVLAGNDTVSPVLSSTSDGYIDPATGAGKYLKDVVGIAPILANIRSDASNGESYALMSVVVGVTQQLVSDVKAGDATAIAEAKALVSATFDVAMLTSAGSVPEASNVVPTSVAGIGSATYGIEVPANATDVLVFTWSNLSWLKAQNPQDSVAQQNTLKATVKFVNAATQTTSNYVGLETKSSGPWVVTNGFVDGDNKTKDLFVRYAGLTNASADVSIPSPTVDEFRTADTLTVYSLITAREDYDGEPDAYFGASSDKIVFSATTGKGDGQTGGQGMSVLYNITYPGGTAIPSTVSSTYTKAASGSDLIVALTGTILNTVITNGAYQNLSMSFTATDDVGNASSSSNNGYRVDSQPPTVLNVSVYTEGSLGKNSSWPWFGAGKIGTKNTAYDTVKIDITVHPEGENTVFGIDPAAPWADISIKPTADDGDSTNPSWTTTTEVKGNSGFASVELVSAAVQTTSFPDTFNNVDAASFTAQMTNDVVANVTKAGFIFSISDNARNNAVLKTGGTVFATTGSLTTTRSGADNPIDAATFVVDNAAPVVLGATIYASGLPSDFLNGDSTSGLFDQLKAVSETVNAISNAFAISATDIRLVTRIAPQSATDGYKGMEVSVDVSFMPASSTPAEVDWKFSGKNADAVSYFNALYIPSVTTENYLADMAGTAVPSLLVEPTSSSAQGNNWSLVSAGFDGANSATAIFKLVNGITYTPSVLTDSIASVTGFARIADKNFNVENTGSLNTTNTFALDTVGPKADQISDPAYISGWQQSTLIKGNGSTANTVFLVTDAGSGYSFTQAFGELSVVGDSSIGGGTTANFKNAYYAATPSVNQVSAGNLIIFAVTFQENDTIGGYRDNDYTPNLFVYFPYVFQGGSKSDLSSSDNIVVPGETFANKLIGKNFKTMSLDFSEFISTSKNLLPDVTSAQSGSKNVTAAAQADIIYATWYLYIDPNNSNLVTNTAVDKIRYITAYSRDLSGNKSQYGFPVGKADFQVPIAAIQSWNIAQPRRSTPVSATSIAGAKTISAATISKAATSQIIVKLTNGPFDPTTFSAGTSNKSLVSLKLRDKANPGTSYGSTGPSSLTFDGVQSVTSGSKIAYATFDIDFSNTSIWSLGTQVVPAVEFIATVTSATGTIGTSISTDTQLDSNPPAVDAVLREGTVVTGDTVETSAPFYVRPGQVLILDVTVTSDTYEDVAGIISQFGLSGNYKNFTNPVTDNIQQISSSSVRKSANTYYYNTTFTVPTSNNSGVNTADVIVSVTDMAGNNTSTSNPAGANRFRIETAKPSIDNVNLSAKADFDRTGAGGTEGSYYLVRQTVYNGKNNVLNLLTTFKPNAVVGSGDIVRVTAEIQPNDPVFTTSDKFTYTGDFSQIGFSKTQAASSSSQLLGRIYATWELTVPATVASVTDASFPISVQDAASTAAGGVTLAPTIGVDTEVIPSGNFIVKVEQYTESNNDKTANAKSTGLKTAGGIAKATVVIEARFPDPSLSSTLFPRDTVGRLLEEATESANTEIVSFFGIDGRSMRENGANVTGVTTQTDPPIVAGGLNGSFTVSRSDGTTGTFAQINNGNATNGSIADSTAYIIQATYVDFPIDKISSAASKFVVKITDTIGNVFSQDLSTVILDGTAPQIAMTDLDVLSGSSLAAVKDASGNIVVPTRVKGGAQMQVKFNVFDNPLNTNTTALNTSLNISDFGPAALLIGNITANTQNATASFPVLATLSTFGPTSGDASAIYNKSKAFNDPSFYTVSSGKVAHATLTVTDLAGNAGSAGSTQLVEVDNQGPVIVDSKVFMLNTLAEVNALTPDSSSIKETGTFVDLDRSAYLVFAGTVVVDGSSSIHFQPIVTDVKSKLEIDNVTRFDTSYQGSILIGGADSATRSLRFATFAIQVDPNAPPAAPDTATFTLKDYFGNSSTKTRKVAIDAIGPRASDIALKVNGVLETGSNVGTLGIGNTGPDLGTGALFELAPGDSIVLLATVSTSNGAIPSDIYADFSSLYPGELANTMKQILPTKTAIDDANDLVVAEWDYIAFDTTNLYSGAPGKVFANKTLITNSANQVVSGATPTSTLNNNNTAFVGADFAAPSSVAEATNVFNNLKGLPGITVQSDPKIASNVASLTVTVDVSGDDFGATLTPSSLFSVDSKRPVQVVDLPTSLIQRALPAAEKNTTGDRAGFPTTPYLSTYQGGKSVNDVPNRLRGGDTASFVFSVTNITIDGTKNDRFRVLPGTDKSNLFSLDTLAADSSVVLVTANLSEFVTGETSLQSGLASSFTHKASLVPSGSAHVISSTYTVKISDSSTGLGTTGTGSRRIRFATAMAVDDSGNMPLDDYWSGWTYTKRPGNSLTNQVQRVNHKPLGVDNRPPTVLGDLTVRLNSGSAIKPNNDAVQIGEQVPNNSKIAPGAVLGISATITDTVDNPLDILNNNNYGNPALKGTNLADATIALTTNGVGLVGTDQIDVPFTVTMPPVGGGISSKNFSFSVSATDTVGNSQTVPTSNQFQYDGDPDLKLLQVVNGVETTVGASTIANASATTVVSASAFDVGGVSQVAWAWDVIPGVTVTTNPAGGSVAFATTEYGGVDLLVMPEVNASAVGSFNATATVTDIGGNAKSLAVTINLNQPALLADDFAAALTSSLPESLPGATITASVTGYTPNVGEDTRSITIVEGQKLVVTVPASDANGEIPVVTAGGSAMTSTSVKSPSFVDNGNGTGTFTFEPGYKAVASGSTSADYVLDLTASDSKIPADLAKLNITVTPQSATPTLVVQSVKVTDTNNNTRTVSNQQVDMYEEETVQIVLKAEDEGLEALSFILNTQPSTALPAGSVVTTGTSPLYATITYTPTLQDSGVVTLVMSATNSSISTNLQILLLNIINVSQAPVITAMASVNGGAAAAVVSGGTVNAPAGASVNWTFDVNDPDNDPIRIPTAAVSGSAVKSSNAPGVPSPIDDHHYSLALTVSATDTPSVGAVISVVVTATDTSSPTNKVRSAKFYIQMPTSGSDIPVAAPYDELVHAQGYGGQTNLVYRNMDPAVDANGDTLLNDFDKTAIIRSFDAMNTDFEVNVGGGKNRAVHLSSGDVNNDGIDDLITTFGPVVSAPTPDAANMFLVYSSANSVPNVPVPPFGGVFLTSQPGSIVNYTTGEMFSAVGNFIGSPTKQIAFVQGSGGNGVLRVLQWNGSMDFNNGGTAWDIVAQLGKQTDIDPDSDLALSGDAWTQNANGAVSIAAGDLDGDGIDELVVGQSRSQTSRGTFQVLKLGKPNASVANVIVDASYTTYNFFDAFGLDALRAEGGINIAVADFSGDGKAEVVISSQGSGTGSTDNSWLAVLQPVITNGQITGFTAISGAIFNAFSQPSGANPSGALQVGAGEFSGFSSDGAELAIGTGAVVDYQGMTGTVKNKAPKSLYTALKLNYTDKTGASGSISVSNLVINDYAEGFSAFQGAFEPASSNVAVVGFNGVGAQN